MGRERGAGGASGVRDELRRLAEVLDRIEKSDLVWRCCKLLVR